MDTAIMLHTKEVTWRGGLANQTARGEAKTNEENGVYQTLAFGLW